MHQWQNLPTTSPGIRLPDQAQRPCGCNERPKKKWNRFWKGFKPRSLYLKLHILDLFLSCITYRLFKQFSTLIFDLIDTNIEEQTLIFANTRSDVDRLYNVIINYREANQKKTWEVQKIHGGLQVTYICFPISADLTRTFSNLNEKRQLEDSKVVK